MRPVALCDAHTHIYRRQPLLVALAVCNSPVRKPNYLHRLSGVNDVMDNWVEERTGVEPAKRFRIAAMVCRVTLATWLYRSRLAEITRPAIGID